MKKQKRHVLRTERNKLGRQINTLKKKWGSAEGEEQGQIGREIRQLERQKDDIDREVKERDDRERQRMCIFPGCRRSKQNTPNKTSLSPRKIRKSNRKTCSGHWGYLKKSA